jgi:predicted porin
LVEPGDGGHQYDSIHDHLAPFTLTGGNGGTAFAHPFDNDNTNNSWLARNSLKYTSSQFDGLSFGGMCVWSVPLAASWTRSIYSGITDAETGLAARDVAFDNYEINGTWQASVALSLSGMYTYTKGTEVAFESGHTASRLHADKAH